ncbi:hypothetical protein J6590_078156 [Homalodisca vitripennis]|nr:hypothetical protein J6590_078156 [Homalodisca vitripennis]
MKALVKVLLVALILCIIQDNVQARDLQRHNMQSEGARHRSPSSRSWRHKSCVEDIVNDIVGGGLTAVSDTVGGILGGTANTFEGVLRGLK